MRSCNRQRGIALLLALFAIVLIATVAFTALSLVSLDTRAALQEQQAARAYYLARSGITQALYNLKSNPWWGTTPVVFTWPDGTASVQVTPAPGNATSYLPNWTVTSIGTTASATRTLVGWCTSQSFAMFLYCSQYEPNGGYYVTGNEFTGPVHTNGHFSFLGSPAFSGQTTTSNSDEASHPAAYGSPFDYTLMSYDTTQMNDGNASNQVFTDPSKFYHAYGGDYTDSYPMALNGSSDFTFSGGQPTLPMPSSMSMLSSVPGEVTVSGTTTITFNANGTATIQPASGAATTVTTMPQQTIYVAGGNVSVSGTVHGQVTLGVGGTPGDSNTGNMFITDNLVYSDKTTDLLGLVALNNIHVQASPKASGLDPTGQLGMEIDGSVMALTGVQDVSNPGGPYAGNLTIYGGLINYEAGVTGYCNWAGQVTNGYNQVFTYDTRLLTMTPPNFPKTGQLILSGLSDLGALGR